MSQRAGSVVLRRESDGRVICERCVLADTTWRRVRGLIGRSELDPGEGIVLRPSWSIHTYFLRFPIDVVFVDADQVVMKVVEHLRPWHAATCCGARDVVELRAGECARLGISAGDRLAWAARHVGPAAPGATSIDSRRSVRAPRHDPIRVVLGSDDDRFIRVARFLLARKQFEVEVSKRLVKTVDLVEDQRADVVVIDATTSLADAARMVAAVQALHPNVAVIVLHDGTPPPWTNGLRVAEKWELLETLADEIRWTAQSSASAARSRRRRFGG